MKTVATAIGLVLSIVSTQAAAQLVLPNGDAQNGRTFALQACSICHIVDPRQLTPVRIPNSVSFRAIANRAGINGMKLQVILTTPHAVMPNLILEPDETADVIAYILSLRDR